MSAGTGGKLPPVCSVRWCAESGRPGHIDHCSATTYLSPTGEVDDCGTPDDSRGFVLAYHYDAEGNPPPHVTLQLDVDLRLGHINLSGAEAIEMGRALILLGTAIGGGS